MKLFDHDGCEQQAVCYLAFHHFGLASGIFTPKNQGNITVFADDHRK